MSVNRWRRGVWRGGRSVPGGESRRLRGRHALVPSRVHVKCMLAAMRATKLPGCARRVVDGTGREGSGVPDGQPSSHAS
eukprot:784839-Pelagomonas_calceolata.AAC.9